jgi:BirA family transcriptional regulator, biotin operon repressor / biotin---[acetyl-CoA-carboxylase] ligase
MSDRHHTIHGKALLTQLADGDFHSGTQLAQALGLSRSAVWKQLHSLNQLGLEIRAVSGKGYKLAPAMQLLDIDQLRTHLSAQADRLLEHIELHDSIHSTNSHLLQQAQQGAPRGRVCLAEYQSAGRGRRGKNWQSPFGHNIYLSVLWRYSGSPVQLSGLSLAVGVACVQALQALGVADVTLKWPNDVLWQRRKLAGILVELSGEQDGPCHAVIGIGLNLYVPEHYAQQIDQQWVDLSRILGETCLQQRNRVAALLLNELLPLLADYQHEGLMPYLERWRALDGLHGRAVQLRIGELSRSGIAQGIDDQGLLRILDEHGELRCYASGEVSLSAATP